jgi:DnaJ-related protein SCJ1
MTITLEEALLGFEKHFSHVDNHQVIVKKDGISFCSEVVRIQGQGMPIRGRKGMFGDLFVTLSIDFPGRFNDKQKSLIKQAMALGE